MKNAVGDLAKDSQLRGPIVRNTTRATSIAATAVKAVSAECHECGARGGLGASRGVQSSIVDRLL